MRSTNQRLFTDVLGDLGYKDVSLVVHRSFSSVYKARNDACGTWVAVKLNTTTDRKIQQHFLFECEVLRDLAGKEMTASFIGAGYWARLPYHITTWQSDPLVSNLIDNDGFGSVHQILTVTLALTSALKSLHASGYCHRDLSPDHIFLREDSQVTLVDFGMSRSVKELSADKRNAYIGYDLHSTGLILAEMLAGRRMFSYRKPILEFESTNAVDAFVQADLPEDLAKALRLALTAHSEFSGKVTKSIGGGLDEFKTLIEQAITKVDD